MAIYHVPDGSEQDSSQWLRLIMGGTEFYFAPLNIDKVLDGPAPAGDTTGKAIKDNVVKRRWIIPGAPSVEEIMKLLQGMSPTLIKCILLPKQGYCKNLSE